MKICMKGAARTGRAEIKYLIPREVSRLVYARLSAILPFDKHASSDGSYHIRSLYFDDGLYRAYFDKEAGLNERKKFRIRYYNQDPSYIRLEEKGKTGSICYKKGAVISKAQADGIVMQRDLLPPYQNELEEDFSRKIRTFALFPVLFTEYTRTTFCHSVGDLRITLDQRVSCARFQNDLWQTGGMIPVIPLDQEVLEIKYSAYFPHHIMRLLDDIPKVPCAVSKYCLSCKALF